MKFIELGDTGEKVPVIGMGTWKLGSRPEEDERALKRGIGLGMTLIDTAQMYHTEELVGGAISGEGSVLVATKVSPHNFRYGDVIKACNSSLGKLRVKSIDLYQLHWPNAGIPITETMKAMEKLVEDGKIRHIGVSNFSVDELIEAQDALKSERIVSNQVEYSPYVRYVEETVVPFCRSEKVTVIAYSPLARAAALLDGKSDVTAALEKVAGRHGRSRAQIALAWLISKGNLVAIPKAASIAHVEENAAAAGIRLSAQDIASIDAARDSSVVPVASKLNKFTKKTASFWSSLMDRRERLRKEHGV
jgi:diketogulonate reductase-like aldo/keto reductase